ncbi:BnaA02g13490D [Brassica napus]|uniref:BnaA02g13490D protein n=1 Tax=Brassica napus TaxID=3708 RepID=A0A078FHK5_BRANA|nr:BnaA02g13490D [Brassica napus]
MKVVVESDMTDELLMRQFLKFNGIEAEGEARVHRKAYGGRSADAIITNPD